LQIAIFGRFWGKCRGCRRQNFVSDETYKLGAKWVTFTLPKLCSYRSSWYCNSVVSKVLFTCLYYFFKWPLLQCNMNINQCFPNGRRINIWKIPSTSIALLPGGIRIQISIEYMFFGIRFRIRQKTAADLQLCFLGIK
jgi:hypothetical protein